MGWGDAIPANGAAAYLRTSAATVPTYDGSGQCTEPAIRFFPTGWNGYKYWMAMNPLPSGNASFENASIVVSNDMQTWITPPGLTNPVMPAPASGNNADAFMTWSPDLVTAYVVAQGPTNPTTGVGVSVFVKSSTDGVTWAPTGQGTVIDASVAASGVEPKLVWDGAQWRYYWIEWAATTGANIYYKTNSNPMGAPGTWSGRVTCAYTIPATNNTAFHFDIIREPNGRYVAALYVNNSGGGVWMASSWDGVNFKVATRPLLNNDASTQSWANSFYRAAITKIGTGHYAIVHGGVSGSSWKLGTLSIPPTEIP